MALPVGSPLGVEEWVSELYVTTKWYTEEQIASAVKRGFLKERTSLATRPAHVGSIDTTCPHPRVHVHAPLQRVLHQGRLLRPACLLAPQDRG